MHYTSIKKIYILTRKKEKKTFVQSQWLENTNLWEPQPLLLVKRIFSKTSASPELCSSEPVEILDF